MSWLSPAAAALAATFALGPLPATALAQAPAASPPALHLSARSAVLIEAGAGRVLYEHNAHQPLPPASVTKIMTLVLALEALRDGRVSLEDAVTASRRAQSMGGTQIWLEVGEQMSYKDLLYAVAVESANDAAVALAEYLAGSEEAFAELMNQRARELGARNTHFSNATGLPPEEVGMAGRPHQTTTYDIAQISRHAYTLPLFRELVSTYGPYDIRPNTEQLVQLWNRNRMLRTYPGLDGIKTGWTQEAGYCLAASALRNDLRLIAVVFNAPTQDARAEDIRTLLDWGYGRYRAVPVARAGEPVGRVRVAKGQPEWVEAVAQHDFFATVPRGAAGQPVRAVTLEPQLQPPVGEGQPVGRLTATLEGEPLGAVRLLARQEARRAGFAELVARTARRLLTSILPPSPAPPEGRNP